MTAKRDPLSAELLELLGQAVGTPLNQSDIASVIDVNQGRGVFSQVWQVRFTNPNPPWGARSLVVKSPIDGPVGMSARSSGAYQREAVAYQRLLTSSPIASPRCWLVRQHDDGGVDLVLDDLEPYRQADQMIGLNPQDALEVTVSLARFHQWWALPRQTTRLDQLKIRRSTPSTLDPSALDRGLAAVKQLWSSDLTGDQITAFDVMVKHRARLVSAFEVGAPTLCHGDPRADNLVFDPDGKPILFDWQQIAVQPGPADLAWLAVTSLTIETRRALDQALVATYGTSIDHYRRGLILPGLTVLLLAQRLTTNLTTKNLVVTSLRRIASALIDLEVTSI